MEKQIMVVLGICLLFVVCLAFFGFNGNVISEDSETIKVGVIIPLSGNGAIYGEWGQKGLEIAKDKINSNDKKIELIYEDGMFKTDETISAFHNLLSQDIKYFITLGSSPAVAISPLANSNGAIQMDFSATTSEYRSEGDFTFRTAPQAEQFGEDSAKWLISNGYGRASMIYINNDQGVSIYEAFREEYEDLGGNLLKSERFDQNGKDFRSVISKSVVDPDHWIFLIGHLQESGMVIKQMNELGVKNPIISHVFSVEGETFLRVAGDYENELVYFAPDYRSNKDFNTREYDLEYKERYWENSEYFGAFAYDALQVLSLAISECSDYKAAECVKDELFGIQGYQGLTGEINFDKFGDRVVDLSLKTIEDGEFVFV